MLFGNMDNKVAIILLNWNGYKDTIECLESLSAIDYINYEIYLVDNGSVDNSVDKIKLFNKKLKLPIKYIQNKNNEGFARGNNIGIENAMQDKDIKYFLLLNNDMVVQKDFLSKLVNEIRKTGKTGVVSPLVFNYYSQTNVSQNDSPGRFNLKNGGGNPWNKKIQELLLNKKPFFVDYTSGSCWLIKKDVVKRTAMFNGNYFAYSEEIELAIRIQKLGFKFKVVPKSKIWHKGGATSNKISGFKVFYSVRNIIWLERTYASNMEFLIFIFNFWLLKFPKNIIIILKQKNRLAVMKKFISAIIYGFFK